MTRTDQRNAPLLRPRSWAGRFLPPLALMALIYFLSAQPDLNSGLGVFDLIGRKLAHATEYGLLWWLWLRALRFEHPWIALLIALVYSGTDEYHQTFVHGRHGTPVDMGFDMTGVAIAAFLVLGWRRAVCAGSDPAALGGDEDRLRAVNGAELPVDVVQVGADRARGER